MGETNRGEWLNPFKKVNIESTVVLAAVFKPRHVIECCTCECGVRINLGRNFYFAVSYARLA